MALLLVSGAVGADPRVSIGLQPQVQVSGGTVLLGQVAHLRSADLALMRKLVDLPLGRAPLPGQDAIVRRSTLAAWIGRAAGLGEGDIEWKDAEAAQVRRVRSVVNGADILREAEIALRARMEQGGAGAVRIMAGVRPRDLDVDGSDVKLLARPLHAAPLRSRMVVWVEVWAAGRFERAVPVSLGVEGAASPGVHATPLQYVGAARAVEGAGEMHAAVTRGERAVLRTAMGSVVLESRVEVLQDGRVGDKVRVRQSGATGIVLARVTGPGAVELAP